MTSRYGLIVAIALAARAAVPAVAQAEVLPSPYDGSDTTAAVITDDDALAALREHGIMQVRTLGRVGDYWEGEGTLNGKPVIGYVYADGSFKLQPQSPGERVRVQSAELPE
jgi:hypothetical protein